MPTIKDNCQRKIRRKIQANKSWKSLVNFTANHYFLFHPPALPLHFWVFYLHVGKDENPTQLNCVSFCSSGLPFVLLFVIITTVPHGRHRPLLLFIILSCCMLQSTDFIYTYIYLDTDYNHFQNRSECIIGGNLLQPSSFKFNTLQDPRENMTFQGGGNCYKVDSVLRRIAARVIIIITTPEDEFHQMASSCCTVSLLTTPPTFSWFFSYHFKCNFYCPGRFGAGWVSWLRIVKRVEGHWHEMSAWIAATFTSMSGSP